MHGMTQSMFHLPLPVLEKVLRPVIVYLCLITFLRLFGKRELAQLNPLDLVVLLSLSNTVQNAMIGDDNSVSGGVIGAFSLLAINWLLSKFLFHAPKVNAALEGKDTVLIRDGMVDQRALQKETLTHAELIEVLNRNGYSEPEEVALCKLEPSGTFFVKGKSPSSEDVDRGEILEIVRQLRGEVAAMRAELEGRGAR